MLCTGVLARAGSILVGVPEPETYMLMPAGLLVIVRVADRRRRRSDGGRSLRV